MSRPRVSDWIGLNCGDTVCRRDDDRHFGRIEAVDFGVRVKVKWHETGWVEYLGREEIVVVEPAVCASASTPREPRESHTVTESPRRQLERELWELKQRRLAQ